MRRVDFDYPNTCPKIDKAIGKAKDEIYYVLDIFLEEVCPVFPSGPERSKYLDSWAEVMYNSLEDIFEGVRESNSDMRHAAEKQIEDLKDEISNLEYQRNMES